LPHGKCDYDRAKTFGGNDSIASVNPLPETKQPSRKIVLCGPNRHEALNHTKEV